MEEPEVINPTKAFADQTSSATLVMPLFFPHLRILGKGSFATVKLAVRKSDGTKWAVKVIEKTALSQEDEEALKNEVQILGVRQPFKFHGRYELLRL